MDGVINLFKPKGMTSHDAVKVIRKILKTNKIGHTGTLDPNASGVLPICIGKATRIVEYLHELDKEYIAELTLGVMTDTQDSEGRVLACSDKVVDEKRIYDVMEKYKGDLIQIPPMYSAIKYKGKKLYELAREGKTIDRQPRNIRIYEQKILNINDCKSIIFYVRCSKGTYIRTLCNDIGLDLGTYGYMSFLIRTGVGNFKISDSYSIEYINTIGKDNVDKILIPIDKALNHLDEFIVEEKFYNKLINGNMIEVKPTNINFLNDNLKIYCKNRFIGIGRLVTKDLSLFLKMDKVLVI
ncbi:MAG TPA: tRNA pseudouridine(55) synthase TruB [Tissierellaceae bacterium]